MPTVPMYDSPHVELGSLPNVKASAPDMPDVASRSSAAIAQGFNSISDSSNKFAVALAQQANAVRVTDAMNQAMQARLKLTYDPDQGFAHLKGEAALNPDDNGQSVEERYSSEYQNSLNDISSKLGNEVQKREFLQQASQLHQQFVGSIQQHVANEFEQHKTDTLQATVDTAGQIASLSYGDPAQVGQARLAVENATRAMYAGQGESIITGKVNRALSSIDSIVVAKAVDGNQLDYARAYYDMHKAELTPEADAHLSSILKIGTTKQQVVDVAAQIWQGSKGDLTSALADARKQKLTPDVLEGVEGRLKTFASEVIQQRQQVESLASDHAWKLVAQGKPVTPSLLAAMPGQARIELEKYRDMVARGETVRTDMQAWLEFTNKSPAELAKLDETQLYNTYRTKLSDSDLNTANTMIREAKLSASGTGGLSVVGSTEDMMKKSAEVLGILPTGTTTYSTAALEKYSAFRMEIQSKVNVREQASGKKATDIELADILSQVKTDYVKRPGFLGMTSTVPAITVPTADRPKSFVTVNGESINSFTIPTAQRQAIIQSAVAHGRSPSEQEIAQKWVQLGKPQ